MRNLVAFALRSGDLHQHQFGGITALEGIRGHQRLQEARGEGYQAEVSVRHDLELEDFALTVRGRIDGVFVDRQPRVVEEIKTTRQPFEEISPNATRVHQAQVQVYALFYALAENLDEVGTQLTYFNLDSGRTFSLRERYRRQVLQLLFDRMVRDWVDWARLLRDWRTRRDQSLTDLAFPFESYRAGQRQFAVASYRALRDGGRLFAQAPTGIGKTAGALFPALKALGEGHLDRIFFLTARTSGAAMAQKALALMRARGLVARSVQITAKDKVCFDAPCQVELCPYALGYYDRLRPALEQGFARSDWGRETVEELAKRHQLCPFELSLDLASDADVVICDYNYAFDPGAYLRRFFGQEREENALLVDEAHNLVDRSCDMYSAALSRDRLLELRRALGEGYPKLAKGLASITRAMAPLRKQLEDADQRAAVSLAPPEKVLPALLRFCHAFEQWLKEHPGEPVPAAARETYFQLRRFQRCCEYFDEHFATLLRIERGDFELKIQCLDASRQLTQLLDTCQASLFFSATLSPHAYFARLLGGGPEAGALGLGSPFPPEHLGVFVHTGVSTKYVDRGDSAAAVAAAIEAVVSARSGHYLVFFPSYAYLRQIVAALSPEKPGQRLLIQDPSMDDAAREHFLAEFTAQSKGTLVGFAVMGGAFAEGIDLVGEALIGVIVVGVGLPMVCQERDLMRAHFDRAGLPGFEFAYQYPGMNRVLQTAGRVIRDESDRGIVCLLDQRFAESRYRGLFPPWWQPHFMRTTAELEQALGSFWRSTSLE